MKAEENAPVLQQAVLRFFFDVSISCRHGERTSRGSYSFTMGTMGTMGTMAVLVQCDHSVVCACSVCKLCMFVHVHHPVLDMDGSGRQSVMWMHKPILVHMYMHNTYNMPVDPVHGC